MSNLKMVNACCIRNCHNRSHDRRGKRIANGVRFFSFPAWKQNSGSRISELTKSHRIAWVEAVRQPNITFDNISRHTFVCSRHFHYGKPAYEMLQNHPDWVPSLHLDHTEGKASRSSLTVNDTGPATPPELAAQMSQVEEATPKENTGEQQAIANGTVDIDSSITAGEIFTPGTAATLLTVLERVTTNQTDCNDSLGKATESPDNAETRSSSEAHIKGTVERTVCSNVSQNVSESSLSKVSESAIAGTLPSPGRRKPAGVVVTSELFCDPDNKMGVAFKSAQTSPVKVKLELQDNAIVEPSAEAKQSDADDEEKDEEEMEVCDIDVEQDTMVEKKDQLTDTLSVSAVNKDTDRRICSTASDNVGSVHMDEMMELADVDQMNLEAQTKADDKRTLIEEENSDAMPSIVNIGD